MNTNTRFCKKSGLLPLLAAIAICAVLVTAVHTSAQTAANSNTPGSSNTNVTVKYTKIQSVSPGSGKQMYAAYCAACHGTMGKGNGPAAAALRERPADLTLLAAHNNGRFPWFTVKRVLSNEEGLPAHASSGASGSSDMPDWLPAFRSLDKQIPRASEMRVHNLVNYVETIQATNTVAAR